MSSPAHEGPASAGLGATLRAARTASGLSLADLERRTKIRAAHLSALEEERLDLLPPPPFVRGFVRTYARALGLDPEPLLARASALASAAPGGSAWQPVQATIEPAQPASRLRRRVSTAGVVALVVAVALVLFFAQQLRELDRPVQSSPPAPAVEPTPPAATPPTQRATPQPTAAMPVADASVTVEVSASGRSWLQVVGEDGRVLFEGFVTAGETRRWQSPGPMTVRVGNAGAVVVTVNGRSVGTLGAQGEVVSRTFGKDHTR
jgi:cytoskeletal protein RodZ